MWLTEKAKMAAILSGFLLALASGVTSATTFTYPNPANCSSITIATSGAISCSPVTATQPVKFTFAGPISCVGLAINAAGAVSCATTLPQGCTLTASPTTAAPGGAITLTASGCTPTPTGYIWNGSGLAANSPTTLNTTSVTLPASATTGPYPYSVIAKNAAGAGAIAETTVKVAVTGYTGPYAYIVQQLDAAPLPGTLSVVDTTNPATPVATVPVGVYPVGVAVNPAGTRVYVTNLGSVTVSVIDTATNQIVPINEPITHNKSIVVGPDPYGIAVNPAGTRVYVANSRGNSVSVIDAVSNIVTATVAVGNTPYGVAVSTDGAKVYVTNYGGNSVSVIDTATNTVTYLVNANGMSFNKPYGIAVNPAGTRIYVANEGDGTVPGTVSVINAANDTVLRQVTVGKQPRGVAVNPAGTKVYAVNNGDATVSVIDASTYTMTLMNNFGALPNFIAFNPAGTLAYVTNYQSGGVSVIDVVAENTVAPIVSPNARLQTFGNFVGPTISAQAGAVTTTTVVEFYNASLDNYFITANSSEAAAIDGGAAGPGWSRTGYTFKSGGSTSVCRFYGSYSPGPNSHFYTVDPAECQGLKDQQIPAGDPRKLTVKSWNFESLDFVSTPPTNGTCPTGTTPVYRAYNNGSTRNVDSNHRIISSSTAILEVQNRGWSYEGVVMCAPQ